MISLFPYRQLVFESPLSKEEIIRRLILEVASRRWGWQWSERRTEKFEGAVSAEGFRISRIIRYRNSFLPVIHGHFCPLARGVRVEVTMRLHIAVLIFSIVWLSFVGLGAATVASQLLSTGKAEAWMLIPCGMLLFFYLMVMIGFGVEADKASKLLSGIFAAGESGRHKA